MSGRKHTGPRLLAMILVAACLASCSGGEDSAVEAEGDSSRAAASERSELQSAPQTDSEADSEAQSGVSVASLDSRYVGPPYQFDAQALSVFANVFLQGDLEGMQRVWGRLTPRQRLEAMRQARDLAASEVRDASKDLRPAQALLATVDYDEVVAAAEREEGARDANLGAVRGIVLERGTGAPVAGARLRATFGTESEADGRFEIRGLSPGSLALAVSKDGFKQLWHDVEIVANQTAEATIHLEALPATVPASGRGVLRGVIVDQETQEPIEGLELVVAFEGSAADLMLGKGDWSTVTNSDGVFEVANIPAGPVFLIGQKLPYFLHEEDVVIVALGVTEERIELSKLRGKVDPPVVVEGVVRDALSGEPVAQATVSVGRKTAVTSGNDGRYLIRLARPGDLTLIARHAAYHEFSEPLAAHKPGRVDRDILIRPITTGAVAGVTVDRTTGEPLADAVITIAGQTLRTDAEGRFRIDELEAGEIAVQAAVDGYKPKHAEVALEALTTTETRLELDPITEGTVAGIVRDAATGRPLAGVRVTAGAFSAETGPDGRFALHEVPAGGQAIVARKPVYEPLADTVEVVAADEVRVELVLEPITYGTLAVIVRDATTDKVIADSLVSVAGSESAQTDDQGRASFERVPAGRVSAAATRHAYLDGGETFTLEPAATIERTVRLEPVTVGGVVGQVVSAQSGEPLSGAEVAMGDQRASTGRDGRFRFEGVAAGETMVTARKAVYEPGRETTSVIAAESVEMRIALSPITYGTVVGVVVDAVSGRPVVDAKITVGALATLTDAQGRFSIERVEAGRLLLSATKPVYEPRRENLELAPAETLEQRLDLQPVTYGALTGRVVDIDTRQPLVGATVSVGGQELSTDRDGRFALDRLDAGQIAVSATKAAYRPGSASVRLDPAGTADAVVLLEAIKVGTVVGVVRDAKTGAPIAGARIAIGGQSLETDAQGRFRLGDVDAGAVTLGARHADYGDGTASGTVTGAGTLDLDIRLDLRREDVTQLETALASSGTIDLYGIHFDSGSDQFKPSSLGTLNAVLEVMKRDPNRAFRIAGHTDSDGTDASNQDLSQRRARTVIGWLAEHGIEAGRLQREGYGESRPAAPNDTVAGKALNRRVELSYAR